MPTYIKVKFVRDYGRFYKTGTFFSCHRNYAKKLLKFGYAVYAN